MRVWVQNIGRPHLVLRFKQGGRQHQRSAGTGDRRDAERRAILLQMELDSSPQDLAWGHFCRLYESEVLSRAAEATRRHWRALLGRIEGSRYPLLRLADCDSRWVSVFLADLRVRCRAATAASYSRRLRAALRWAGRQGLLPSVPNVDSPPCLARRGRSLTAEEFDRMLAAATRYHPRHSGLEDFLAGLWTSGIRVGELFDLDWDPHSGHWAILNLENSHRQPVLQIPGSRQKRRRNETIPCAPEFATLLRTRPPQPQGRIFSISGPRGPVRSLATVRRLVSSCGRRAGIVVQRADDGTPKFASAHDLRRTWATRWAQRGLSVYELTAAMRHASIETTRQYYLDLDAETISSAMAERAKSCHLYH